MIHVLIIALGVLASVPICFAVITVLLLIGFILMERIGDVS